MPKQNQIQFRKGTGSEWTNNNPILASGEPGYETDSNRLKIGLGLNWDDTQYISSDSLITTVYNNKPYTISGFNVIYIDGGQGNKPTIALSIASGEMTSARTYGITINNIPSNSSGLVITNGSLKSLNTNQFGLNKEGSALWLSPTVSGGITLTKPYAPNHAVFVGTIVRSHNNQGVVEVKIQNGYELEELHNVAITGVTNGQFLYYNSSSGLWQPNSNIFGNNNSIGIGTNSPERLLDVRGNAIFGANSINMGRIIFAEDIFGGELGFIDDGDQTLAIKMNDGSFQYGGGNPGAGNLIVTSAGNVGIGTISPTAKLDIAGTLKVNGDPIVNEGATLEVGQYAIGISTYSGPVTIQSSTAGDGTITIGNGFNDTTNISSTFTNINGWTFDGDNVYNNNGSLRCNGLVGNTLFAPSDFDGATNGDLNIGNYTRLNHINWNINQDGNVTFNSRLSFSDTVNTPSAPSVGSVSQGTRLLLTENISYGNNAIGVEYAGTNHTWFSVPSGKSFKYYDMAQSFLDISKNAINYNNYSFAVSSTGSIDYGSWNASTISVNKGGTGRTSYSNGQLLIGSGTSLVANTLSSISGIGISNGSGTITIGVTGIPSSTITNFNSSVSGLLPTISNSGDNRVLTSTGSSVGMNAESNLTFDGNLLNVVGSGAFSSGLNIANQTASRIASFDSNKNIISLDTTIYPSLTELAYVKGTTSSIQNQLNSSTIVRTTGNQTITGNKTFSNTTTTLFEDGSYLSYNVSSPEYAVDILTESFPWIFRARDLNNGTELSVGNPTNGDNDITISTIDDIHINYSTINFNGQSLFQAAIGAGANGQLLIGNGSSFAKSTLTAGTGISITNGSGSITINSSLTNPVTGVGTSGYLTKWISSSEVSSGVIFDNGSRVGIGTTTPSGQLHIVGTGLIDGRLSVGVPSSLTTPSGALDVAGTIFVRGSGNNTSRINLKSGSIADDQLCLRTDTNGNLYVDCNGGNLKLGSQDGQVALNGYSTNIHIGHSYNANSNAMHIRFVPGGTELMRMTCSGTMGIGLPTTSNLFNQQPYANTRVHIAGSGADSGSAALIVTNSGINPLFYVRNDGNIGIGTTSPSSKLDVNGNVNIDGNLTFDSFTESVVAIGNSSTSQTISLTSGTVQTCTLTGNCTFTMPSATAGKSFTMFLNSGSGNYTASFSGVRWADSAIPTATILANKVDIYSFISDGSYWYGSFSQNYG